MKKLLSGLMIAATLAGGLAASVGSADAQDWRYRRPPPGGWHHHDRGWNGGDAAAAAAAGLIGGMIIGGAIAQSQADQGYEDDYVVRRRPQRVYVDDEDYPRVHRTPHCRTLIKYDMYGKPYEFKDCDP
ncbi:MAG: hypothetical protein GX458_16860 [Phyllobacteriaceae bacterium]|nr:hypothetical protein [Phyllobacteriaceae bacterium]